MHVLDTAHGVPASGMAYELWWLGESGQERRLVLTGRTNADGRGDGALIAGDDFRAGYYELVYAVGEYFTARGISLASPPFLDRVPIRFGVADPSEHYHVPLQTSPWAYNTYRGS